MGTDKSKWKQLPLGDWPIEIIDGDRSKNYPKRTEFVETGIPFLNSTNFVDDTLDTTNLNYISEEKAASIRKGKVQRDDIIMTTRGSIGKLVLFNCGYPLAIINAQMLIVRADGRIVDPIFLFNLLRSENVQAQIKNFSSGSAQPQIPIRDLVQVPLKIPGFQIQRRIASILSAYDDLIENNTRRIQILEEMAQKIYTEWFVHFRFPGHEKVKMVDSELGRIPKGWEVKPLSEISSITMGQSPKSQFYNETGEGIPFHQGVRDYGAHFPTDRLYCTVQNRIAHEGDILFSVRAPVGRINIATKTMVIGRGLSAIRSKQNSQIFLLCQLRHKFSEEDLIGGGTIFKAVTKKDMYEISMLHPIGNIIEEFQSHAKPIWKIIRILSEKNNNLRQTRDLLLPRLISGDIDVSEMPDPEEVAAA